MVYNPRVIWQKGCDSYVWGFFGFLWSGEFTATPMCNSNHVITVADISVDSHSHPQVVTITLRHSKTDQAEKGSVIYLGRTGYSACWRSHGLGRAWVCTFIGLVREWRPWLYQTSIPHYGGRPCLGALIDNPQWVLIVKVNLQSLIPASFSQ